MKQGKFNIIIGGQAGSEAKGKLSGWLCDKYKPELLASTSSPNAGHTVVTPVGEKKISYHLPIGMVMCNSPVVLGPASLINPISFAQEIKDLGVDPGRITIDPRASIITPSHIFYEKTDGLSDIGSTLQGIGECRINKIRRKERVFINDDYVKEYITGVNIAPTSHIINSALDGNKTVLCETTQGFDLDLEHGISPTHCTSKMINPAMAMAEAGVSPTFIGDVYGVIRPYPIRVNNRTGYSGDYAGASEISWEEITRRCKYSGVLTETTTTTKLTRRVFEFSFERYKKFLEVCRPNKICLQFANYIDWNAYKIRSWNELPPLVKHFVNVLSLFAPMFVPVKYVGTGPGHDDMIEV